MDYTTPISLDNVFAQRRLELPRPQLALASAIAARAGRAWEGQRTSHEGKKPRGASSNTARRIYLARRIVSSLEAVRNAAAFEIIGTKLNLDPVA